MLNETNDTGARTFQHDDWSLKKCCEIWEVGGGVSGKARHR